MPSTPTYLEKHSDISLMKKVSFQIEINQPASIIYDIMLGLSDIKTYEAWTAIFNPTSSYEGSWDKGSKILFVGTDGKGEKGGMVSQVMENKTNAFVSIRHYGMIKAGKEITEGPEVEGWANSYENYTFEEKNGSTLVTVELDTSEDFEEYMNKTYPKSLLKLKEISEQ